MRIIKKDILYRDKKNGKLYRFTSSIANYELEASHLYYAIEYKGSNCYKTILSGDQLANLVEAEEAAQILYGRKDA